MLGNRRTGKTVEKLKEKLKDRNYPDRVIDEKFEKAKNKDKIERIEMGEPRK